MEWISVEDEMPDDVSVTGPVAALVNGEHLVIAEFNDMYGDAHGFAFHGPYNDGFHKVTHWMPLPQPPIGE